MIVIEKLTNSYPQKSNE